MGLETDETKIPITKEFLEKVLKRKIVRFETSGGSNPGDNFCTVLVSIEVHLVDTREPLYLLFKTFPTHPTRQKMLEDTNLFLKEMLVYDVWMKELVNFQKEVVGSEKVLQPAIPQFVAGAAIDYLKEELDPNANPSLSNFILMVDVRKTWGFQMANKLEGLSYNHVKVVMKELAKLHALAYAYKKHKGLSNLQNRYPCLLGDPFFGNPAQMPTINGMISTNTQVVRDVLRNFFNERPEIAENFKRLVEEPEKVGEYFRQFLHPDGMNEEEVENLTRTKPEAFSGLPIKEQWIVANHGDCWTNNMLFKTDDTGKVTDTILVDLQGVRESCIMADLSYFIYTSTDTSFRAHHLEEMLSFYYDKFIEYCNILKVTPFEGFTLQNLKRKFHRSKIFGFYFALMIVPIILMKPESAIDMDSVNIDDGDEGDGMASLFKKISTRDEEDVTLLRNRFQSLLTELYDEGVL